MDTTVYATTSWRNQPKVPPTAEVRKIARGEAMAALLHSSARWKGESYLLSSQQMILEKEQDSETETYPLIVQITPIKLIKILTPEGKSVPA